MILAATTPQLEGATALRLRFDGLPVALLATLVTTMPVGRIAAQTVVSPGEERRPVHLEVLRGEDAEDCPSRDELADAVAARLGYQPFSAAEVRPGEAPASGSVAGRSVVVQIRRANPGYVANLTLLEDGESQGQRQLSARGQGCQSLAAAVELAVAIAIDPLALSDGSADRTTTATETSDRTEDAQVTGDGAVPPTSPATDDHPRQPDTPVIVAEDEDGIAPVYLIGIDLHLSLGSAPALAPGILISGAARLGSFSLGIEGRADLPASAAALEGEVEAAQLLGGLAPCVHVEVANACAVVAGGVLRAVGRGFAEPQSVTVVTVLLGARIGAQLPVSPSIAITLRVEALAPMIRTSLLVDDDIAWQTAALSFAAGAGVRLVL